ncbi:MAG: ATP-binding protein [Gammaproteobacteria bacterium]
MILLRHLRPRNIFARTALVLMAALLVLQGMNIAVGSYLIGLPLLRNSVDDLAALMTLAAQTYTELPPITRPDFVIELKSNHRLELSEIDGPKNGAQSYLPYALLLETALERRLHQPVKVQATATHPVRYWVDVHIGLQWLRIMFSQERIGTHPPITLLVLLLLGLAISVFTALILARRLTGPLVTLSQATREIGYGYVPPPISEEGPEELAILARNFNNMARRVRALLDTRTTLLAGISHDLRTPIARLRLAIELMRDELQEERVAAMERDLEEMDALIGQLLDTAREVRTGQVELLELAPLVLEVVNDVRRGGATIDSQLTETPCLHYVNRRAFQRVLANLLENALRHGRPPVIVRLTCVRQHAVLEVEDCGPGIPSKHEESVFRPFVAIGPSAGSGLGLAIVHGIVHAYGWEISLRPRPGGGTIARLSLSDAPPAPLE